MSVPLAFKLVYEDGSVLEREAPLEGSEYVISYPSRSSGGAKGKLLEVKFWGVVRRRDTNPSVCDNCGSDVSEISIRYPKSCLDALARMSKGESFGAKD